MIDATTIAPEKLRFTLRLIVNQAAQRGWKTWIYHPNSSHLRVQRDDSTILELFSATPPTTSYAAAHRADDKYLTHIVMEEAGIPVLETYLALTEDEAHEAAQTLFASGRKCVVKPLDAGHGNGITVEVDSPEMLSKAYAYARTFSDGIIIQEHFMAGVDIRLTCIGYKFVAALVRVPARVKGDGTHTVEQLIAIENAKEHRGINYSKELNQINLAHAQKFLGDDFISVPPLDVWVQVLGTANVGTGGETIDVTDVLPDWFIAQAERAARAAELPLTGVDFMVQMLPSKEHSEQQLQPRLIEVNKCPSLFIHEYPTHGTAHPATAAYLDYLATL